MACKLQEYELFFSSSYLDPVAFHLYHHYELTDSCQRHGNCSLSRPLKPSLLWTTHLSVGTIINLGNGEVHNTCRVFASKHFFYLDLPGQAIMTSSQGTSVLSVYDTCPGCHLKGIPHHPAKGMIRVTNRRYKQPCTGSGQQQAKQRIAVCQEEDS